MLSKHTRLIAMIYCWCIVGAGMLFGLNTATAESASEFLTKGEYLMQNCAAVAEHKKPNTIDDASKRNWCLGFLRGTLDMVALVHVVVGDKIFFCIPDNVDEIEEAKVLVSYLDAHKDQWNSNQLLLVINAFSDKFPCAEH